MLKTFQWLQFIYKKKIVSNNIIELVISINVMTMEAMKNLNICNIKPTHIVVELVNRSKVKLKGALAHIFGHYRD